MSAIRKPRQAGRFYPASEKDCRLMLKPYFYALAPPPAVGALVPHAGWVFSGPTAAKSIASVAAYKPDTYVIFGAVHVMDQNLASLYPSGTWLTPLGGVSVDQELADALQKSRLITVAPEAHSNEHSIEVELPLLQEIEPNAQILPIMVRPSDFSAIIGEEVAAAAEKLGRRVAYLASTDLTHYGPMFGFEPAGHGKEGVRWAKEVNDRRFIDLVTQKKIDDIVPEAIINRNACGAGAVAAMLGALRAHRHEDYVELEHTTSAEVDLTEQAMPTNSVGYEAGIFPSRE